MHHRRPLLQTMLALGKLEEVRDEWKQAAWTVSGRPEKQRKQENKAGNREDPGCALPDGVGSMFCVDSSISSCGERTKYTALYSNRYKTYKYRNEQRTTNNKRDTKTPEKI